MVVLVRVLVTGGAGFIGTHLVRRLAEQGHQVTVLDDFSTGAARLDLTRLSRLVQADVRDAEGVSRAARKAECVYHLAAVVGVRHALQNQVRSLTVDWEGTKNVLEAAEREGAAVFVASSSAVYGKTERLPIGEKDDIVLGNTHLPSWTYSAAKLAEELLARAWSAERGLPVKVGRFFNVIGPGQTGAYGMVVPRFVEAALKGNPLVVYGRGDHARTFVDIRDALDGLERVMQQGGWGEVYNIGGAEEITVLELARRVLTLAGSSSPVCLVPFEEAFGPDFEEIGRRVPDIRRLRALGYEPRRTLEETLQSIIEEKRGA